MSQPTIIQLGRFGDIVNALPAAYSLARKGARPRFVVSKDFRSILEGVSYVDPVGFDGDYSKLTDAIKAQKSAGFDPMVFQAYKHPDRQRLTKSYNQEGWRIAGFNQLFGAMPLVFDNRSMARERELERITFTTDLPKVLIALDGISSPFPLAQELRNLINAVCGSEYEVVDLCRVKAERPYDLIGLIDRAVLLVSIDTLHLHLARASKTPLISIVQDGWFGSSTPPQNIASFRYQEAKLDLLRVGSAVENFLFMPHNTSSVIHVVNMFGKEVRHRRAQESWPLSWSDDTVTVLRNGWYRTSKDIGDPRSLPYLKDIFESALELAKSDDDCVVWMNDDVELRPGALEDLRRHVQTWDAVSVRRLEPGVESVHMGRELFAFRAGWLRRYLPKIPDYLIGTEGFDLGLAAFIRAQRGIPSTFRNFSTDFFPCELPPGMAIHEPHESAWASMSSSPANTYNRKLFRNWASSSQPTLKFNASNEVCI